MVKRFFFIFGILILLAVGGLAIFLATFDADRYRPLAVSELERALKRPVTLNRLSLGWHGGIAIQLKGLVIQDGQDSGREPLLAVGTAHALVRLWPLLRKDIQVASVTLHELRIHVDRDQRGVVNLTGLAAAAAPAGAATRRPPAGANAVSFNIGSLRIEDGTLHWTDSTRQPPTEVWLRSLDVTVRNIASGRPMDLELSGALGGAARNIQISGRITLPSATSPGAVDRLACAVDRVPLEALVTAPSPENPQVHGQLSLAWQGSLPTLDPAELLWRISGNGTLTVGDPRIANLNLLREVFDRIAVIPGLVQTLQERLPPAYQSKLAAADTVLSPIAVAVHAESGALRLEEIRIATDSFQLTSSGRIGFDGALALQSMLRIDPTLSAAVIQSVRELAALTNAQGELEMPLLIGGRMPQIGVLPDLNYVASKLVAAKAANLLGRFLGPSQSSDQANPTDQLSPSNEPPPTSASNLLGHVLRKMLAPQDQPDVSTQQP